MDGTYQKSTVRQSPAPFSRDRSAELFRETTRAPLKTNVRLQFDAFGDSQVGYTANVSRGGFFVGCMETKPVGTVLKFELDLGPSQSPVQGLAEVVWLRLKQRDLARPPGMGIQFRFLDGESYERLERALRETILESGVPEEPEASAVGVAERAGRLRVEIEQALASCHDLGCVLDRHC